MNFCRKIVILLGLGFILFSCQENGTSPPVEPDDPGGWQLLGLENEPINAIAVDQFNEDVLYAGSRSDFSAGKVGGLFKSNDGGAVWDTLIRGITVRDIDIHPRNSNIVYVTCGINGLTRHGILKTVDGGMNWTWSDTGLHLVPEEGPGVMSIDPIYPDTLYLGTGGVFGGKLYKSTDASQSWQAVGTNVYMFDGVTAIAIDPLNTAILYVAGLAGGFKSTDGGSSWNRLNFPEDIFVKDFLVHPDHTDTVYAGTWGSGFYFSENSGDSWESGNLGIPDTCRVEKLLISSSQIYIAANVYYYGSVYRSNQNNFNWSKIGMVVFDSGIRTANLSLEGNRILAGAYGIYVLTDTANSENNP